MGASERIKGQQAERELAHYLTDRLGSKIQRQLGQERAGGHDLEVGEAIGIQVKRQERAKLQMWLEQAAKDSEGTELLPAVAWRPSRGRWVVAMDVDDWIQLVREAMK